MKTTLVFAIGAAVAPLASQSVTPAELASAEGWSRISRPFGSASAGGWRYQQVHDDLRGKNVTVRSVSFRRDAGSTSPYMAYSLNVTLILSTAKTTSATMATNFDANHGANKAVVLNQQVSFPTTFHNQVPAPWEYEIKLPRPYNFNGATGGLCWEAQTTLHQNLLTTVYLDAAWTQSTNPPLAAITFGSGCRHSTRITAARATGSSTGINWTTGTGSIIMNGSNLAPGKLAIAVLGFSRTNYGPIPLPFLVPGTAHGPSGPCSIYTSLDVLAPLQTLSNGTASLTFPIVARADLHGLRMSGQFLTQDAAIPGPIQVITSNGVEWNWVKPWKPHPVSRSFASNTFAATGTVQKNYGLVVALR